MKMISLYDENCSLCQATKKWFERLDWMHKVNWISLQEYEKKPGSLVFSRIDLRRELHLVLPDGKVLKGFFAVRKLLLNFPLTFIVGFLLYLPLMPILGVPVYKWIAKNRYKLLRKNCDSGSCSL